MNTGVSEHAEKGVLLYEDLVYGQPKVRARLMAELYEKLKSSLAWKKSWDIIDIGIGGGWLILALIEQILQDDHGGPERVNLIGVDTSREMLLHLLDSIETMDAGVVNLDRLAARALRESPGDGSSAAKQLSLSVGSPNGKTHVSVRLINRDFLAYASRLRNYRFDVCLIFFFFHHLGEAWRDGVLKVIEILHPEHGMVVLSEIGGDHACWSSSFDDIYNIDHLLSNEQRRKYLQFVARCLTLLKEEYGAKRPSQEVSAANVKPVVEALRKLGFNGEYGTPNLSKKYDTKIRTESWLQAGGLREGYSRTFSVFPELSPDKKHELSERLDDIAQALDLDLHDQFTVKDRLKLYILQRDIS